MLEGQTTFHFRVVRVLLLMKDLLLGYDLTSWFVTSVAPVVEGRRVGSGAPGVAPTVTGPVMTPL